MPLFIHVRIVSVTAHFVTGKFLFDSSGGYKGNNSEYAIPAGTDIFISVSPPLIFEFSVYFIVKSQDTLQT